MWDNKDGLLLAQYFEDKEMLSALKIEKAFLECHGYNTDEVNEKINKVTKSIRDFISALDSEHLKSIIYMSLDIDDGSQNTIGG